MRRLKDGNIIFSPTDLVIFSISPFSSWMDRASIDGKSEAKKEDPAMDLLARMGEEHERKVLADLRLKGPVADLSKGEGFEEICANSIAAFKRREKVLYQAALRGGRFQGYADFIILDDDGKYKIWDTKLARSPRPYFIIQLCAYSEMFLETFGEAPSGKFGIILGPSKKTDDDRAHVEFAFEDFRYYYENLKQRFLAFHDAFTGDISERPEPGLGVDHGRWQEYVDELLLERDHLSRVAGISRGQITKLEANNITTLGQLAEFSGTVAKIPAATLTNLSTQARLQRDTEKLRETDPNAPPLFELRPKYDGATPQGLYALPDPSPKDVFFDMEGFPFNGGLEYLFGNIILKKDGTYEFVDFWAHDRAQEKKAFEAFIDWVYARWQEDDSLHIYHYANYEKAAISNLMTRHDTREKEVDDLLRNNVLVDLYRIIKNGVYVGEKTYSLKQVEHLYNIHRGENVASAVDSVLHYANWIESGEPEDWRKSEILKGIRDYNEVDCVSTADLCKWLRKTAADNGIRYTPYQTSEEDPKKPEDAAVQSETYSVVSALRQRNENDEDPIAGTLSDLVNFHRREAKPDWWRFFDLAKRLPEELFDEPDCIADATRVGEPAPDKKSLVQKYTFDRAQECRLAPDKELTLCFQADVNTKFSLRDLDYGEGEFWLKATEVTLKKSEFRGSFPSDGSLILNSSINYKPLRAALREIGRDYLDDSDVPSMDSFLSRRPPAEAMQEAGETTVEAAIRIAERMDGDCLVVQGPPGTGKTYTAARLILALLKKGKRVGMTSNSHKAIFNLIRECCDTAEKENEVLSVQKSGGDTDDPVFTRYSNVESIPGGKAGVEAWLSKGKVPLLCGTAWLFSRDEFLDGDGENLLDFLFIDEAGQVPLANAVAVSRSTRNLVLLGDQMQLENPMQGKHPGDAGLSALQYALKDVEASEENGSAVIYPVLPDGHGLFLPVSRRMHPDVCEFISESIYEGRLEAAEGCEVQRIALSKEPNALITKEHGIVFSPVEHDGDTQYSDDEVSRVVAIYEELLGKEYTDRDGKTRKLELKDFLFITPYNAQVVRLSAALSNEARIGSVDRLQGQQAPVCILSLCSSVGEYGSRGLAFILDLNRINVAISRAQCLAVVVADPRIAQDSAGSVTEMRLLNLFCKLSKY
ncbi:MAG: TM0106 family RecB-like putative nuclease [Acidobacteria bacterium]|nr:TM0106 family RecB-like putative nuclease [Acidobacteriota bacterium]